jgi:hypothetical protein
VAPLHPQQAIKLARAQLDYLEKKRALERAKETRDEQLQKYKGRLPLKEWVTIAGHRFRYSRRRTGRRFSLSDYLAAGNKVTKAMEPYVSDGSYDHLEVEAVDTEA